MRPSFPGCGRMLVRHRYTLLRPQGRMAVGQRNILYLLLAHFIEGYGPIGRACVSQLVDPLYHLRDVFSYFVLPNTHHPPSQRC